MFALPSTHSLGIFAEWSSNLFPYQQLRKGISLIVILQRIQQNLPLKPSKFGTLNVITLVVSGLENRYLYAVKAPEAMHFNTTNRLVFLVCIKLHSISF